MKTLYLDCGMGAAGDMLTAALLELVPDQAEILKQLNGLGLPGVVTETEKTQKCGITGTHVHVIIHGEEEESRDVPAGAVNSDAHPGEEHGPGSGEKPGHDHASAWDHDRGETDGHGHDHGDEHDHSHTRDFAEEHDHSHEHGQESDHDHEHHHHHHHTSLAEVEQKIQAMPLPEDVQQDSINVYHLIAEAEGHAHGMPVEEIHFHEVGTLDAIMDVVSVCLLMHELHPDRVVASPVRTGFGQVHCAHGIMPVPAPATAFLLEGIPTYSGDIRGEMCTPTGAALLKYFVHEFARQPLMRTERVGYGMGSKDFPAANCIRAFLGEELEFRSSSASDRILELRCNIDDMTGEEMGYAVEQLLKAGARDVFTTPIFMKKNRPGILLTVLCSPEDQEKMTAAVFHYTTTIGIRRTVCERDVLEREEETRDTAGGPVRVKISSGFGVRREKAEYEDLKRIADADRRSLREAEESL